MSREGTPVQDNPPPEKPLGRRLAERARIPRLSGKASAACLVACFGLTAVFIPTVLKLPLWVEFEIVLAIWWLVWFAVLARLLYVHQFVEHDHTMAAPRLWWGKGKGKGDGGSWLDGWTGVELAADEGVAVGCAIVVGLILLFFALWFLIEIAIPVILFLLYFVVRGMLARVVNDRHGCKDNVAKSLGWAAVWATVYTAPLALVVWVVHLAQQPR